MEKILSIIIPTYNMEKYLRKCLDSLIVSDENMENLEVLVINDGSKDSSSQIGHEYESKYPQTFRVIDKENGNYGSCINRGLKEATGKYIKVLDADDYFDSDVFEKYISFLSSTDVDMILTDYNEVNEEGEITKKHLMPYNDKEQLYINDYCTNKFFSELQMHAVTYKRSLLIDNNYTQTTGVSYTDQEWMYLPITYMKTFCHFICFLYQYLVGRDGQTIDPKVTSKQVDVRFRLIYKRIKIYSDLVEKGETDKIKIQFLQNRLLNSSYFMYKSTLIQDNIPMEMIRNFDEGLKKIDNNFYDEMSISELCKWKGYEFIGYWRKHKRLPFSVKLMKIFYKLKKRL